MRRVTAGGRTRVMAWGLVTALAVGGVVGPASAATVRITAVQVVEGAGAIEVRIAATAPVAYRTLVLDDPVRLVVDLPGAVLAVARPVVPVNVGAVVQVRLGQLSDTPPVARVVIDLKRAVEWRVRGDGALVVARLSVAEARGVPSPGVDAQPGAAAGSPAGADAPSGAAGGGPRGAPARAVGAGPAGIVVAQGVGGVRRLTLDLRDAALPDVIDALARLCGLNLVTDASVSGKVTIHLVGVTCEEAIRFVLEANALGFRRVGETLIVEAAAKLAPPPPVPVTRVYRLAYLQPPVSTPEPLVGSSGTGLATVAGGAGPLKKDVATLLGLFAGTGATLQYDDRLNALVVTGTPIQHEAFVGLLRQLDVPIPQVVVQALVVDITATSLRDLGIEWSLASGATGAPLRFTETVPPAGQFGIGTITRDALFARLHAFVQEGHAKVLSDPRVATPDGQQALIFAGDQIPIVSTTTSGNPPVTTETVTFQPIGVTLKITPKILADRTISVQVHPAVTTVTAFTPPTSANPQGLPQLAVREAVTSLVVGDGQSLILGGLMRYSDVKNLSKLPLLGDLPLIGSLFRLTTNTHSESEVVIIITPRILTSGTPVQQ